MCVQQNKYQFVLIKFVPCTLHHDFHFGCKIQTAREFAAQIFAVMNDKVGKSPLDADGHAGGDENVTPADCFVTFDETILKGRNLGIAVVFFDVPYSLSVSGRCLHMSPQFVG